MFWDKISGIYDLYQIVNKKVNDEAAFLCAKQIKSNDIVLECACGTGIMTKFIAPCCKKLVATDFSRKMLKQAKKKLKDQNNVLFRYADITDLKFKDNCFDKVVAANVIHLLDDPEKAMSELKRVVKPGGQIILPTYVAKTSKMSSLLIKIFNAIGADFKKEFDEDSYKKFLADMGITATYHTAKGTVSCCVAIIDV
jgi:ubiquinone/menaquinone biosynthesis C-methylase UbiE